MRAAEMRRLTPEELAQRLNDSADDLFRLKFQLISGQLQDYVRIKQARKEIARIKTIIRERELQVNQTPTEVTNEESVSAEE
jgi:large subunit ribosomal protein L29